MPVADRNRALYPSYWPELSDLIRSVLSGGRCEFCEAENKKPNPATGSTVVLTVAHMDHDPTHNDRDNLRALCQRCHLRYDANHKAKTRIKK